MKKSVIVVMMIMMAFGLKLFAGEDDISYVKAEGKTYLGTEVKIGLTNTKITTLDGAIVKIPNAKVDAYVHNSRMFERLPVVCENNIVECLALMEFVTSRSGLRLYRFTSFYEDIDPWANRYGKATQHDDYYVFKDGQFYLLVNKKNAASVLPFFGIEVL